MIRPEARVSYSDISLKCRECGQDFVFSAGEQEFFASRGLQNQPGRCPSCRAARRQRTNGFESSAMPVARPRREMHQVICHECGAPALVPFVPRTDKPVYCSNCFDAVRAGR
jgi:CxxC-x17-CxxC domain-containing protein